MSWRTSRDGAVLDDPPHAAVDWSRAWRENGKRFVPVVCPECGKERVYYARDVRTRIRHRGFTGICAEDSQRIRTREHTSVDWSTVSKRGHEIVVDVTCPICGETRTVLAAGVRKAIAKGAFTGRCLADR